MISKLNRLIELINNLYVEGKYQPILNRNDFVQYVELLELNGLDTNTILSIAENRKHAEATVRYISVYISGIGSYEDCIENINKFKLPKRHVPVAHDEIMILSNLLLDLHENKSLNIGKFFDRFRELPTICANSSDEQLDLIAHSEEYAIQIMNRILCYEHGIVDENNIMNVPLPKQSERHVPIASGTYYKLIP